MFKFHGGANLKGNKKQSRYFKIEPIPAPSELIIPLSQSLGTPAKPIVSSGDRVLQGQKIAVAEGALSANIHSPVSGVVEKIALHVHPNGSASNCIFIKNDFHETKIRTTPKEKDISLPDLVEAVREAGIVDSGDKDIPAHVKLSFPPNKKVKAIIINGCESESYLTSKHRLMLEVPEKIIIGAHAINQATMAEKIYIAIENNKKDAVETLKQYTKQLPHIEIVSLPAKYPQDAIKPLISSLTGIEIPNGKNEIDYGFLVFTIDTTVAIADCLTEGAPLTHTIVTVAGSGFTHAQNYRVPIGTPISHIIEAHGGFAKTPNRLIMGGPMKGIAQISLEVPIVKTTTAILALADSDVEKERETPCIRCGRCVLGCPVRLRPINLANLIKKNNIHSLAKENISDCIECGVCSYNCPAKIHLLEWIKAGKQMKDKTC